MPAAGSITLTGSRPSSYAGLKILTLDEVIDIAQGNPLHKPGLYIETKEPKQFPGLERDLKEKLQDRGWLSPIGSKLAKSELAVGQGKGKVVLQTFEKGSLELLEKEMPQVPKILLLWVGAGSIEPKSKVTFAESGDKDKATFYARQQPKDKAEFQRWVEYAKAQGAIGTGPSVRLTQRGDQSYSDLVQPWMNQYTHDQGLLVHAYTVDDAWIIRRSWMPESMAFSPIAPANCSSFINGRRRRVLRSCCRTMGIDSRPRRLLRGQASLLREVFGIKGELSCHS